MQHDRVKSSTVFSLGHDPHRDILEARFVCFGCKGEGKNGESLSCKKCKGTGASELYRYYEVPAHVFLIVRDAESVGKAFDIWIKRSGYKYKKVGESCEIVRR